MRKPSPVCLLMPSMIHPQLKKPSLNPGNLSNYNSVLNFVFKSLEWGSYESCKFKFQVYSNSNAKINECISGMV